MGGDYLGIFALHCVEYKISQIISAHLVCHVFGLQGVRSKCGNPQTWLFSNVKAKALQWDLEKSQSIFTPDTLYLLPDAYKLGVKFR